MKKLLAELFGTFWLVFGGCGSAIFAAAYPELGIGFAGVALAFGLTVLTMAYAVGHISGGHFNPAVTFGLWAFVAEFLLTAFFLLIIIGSTSDKAPKGFAPIAIGLGLTLIHLISIPITNTSVNPARSFSQALFAEGAYLSQLWLFWLAPIAGAIVAGFVGKFLLTSK